MKHKIAGLLSSGATAVQVARAVGVSASYISQLLTSDREFEAVLGQLSHEKLEEDIALGKAYKGVEVGILEQMNAKLPTADIRELSMALVAVTGKGRTGGGGTFRSSGEGNLSVSVSVHLPAHMADILDVNVVKNARNEIVEMEGRNFRGLTETEFSDNLSSMKEGLDGIDGGYHASTESKEIGSISQRLEEINGIVGL